MPEGDPEVVTIGNAPEGSEVALEERARVWLEQILSKMGLEVQVQVRNGMLEIEATGLTELQKSCLLGVPPIIGSSRLQGTGAESGGVGITLDALQYLANTLLNLNQPPALQRSYTLELEGYRQRRQQELQAMAAAAVEQVRASGTEYEFKALSAAERRQLHTLLDTPDYADLATFSRGREPDRRLVIQLAATIPSEDSHPEVSPVVQEESEHAEPHSSG